MTKVPYSHKMLIIEESGYEVYVTNLCKFSINIKLLKQNISFKENLKVYKFNLSW